MAFCLVKLFTIHNLVMFSGNLIKVFVGFFNDVFTVSSTVHDRKLHFGRISFLLRIYYINQLPEDLITLRFVAHCLKLNCNNSFH